jgi:hypothetical protein
MNSFYLVIFFILILQNIFIFSQTNKSFLADENNDNNENNGKVVGVTFLTGYMIPHSNEVNNVRGANPRGIELAFYNHLNSDDVWLDCECYPRFGFFASYYHLDLVDILGHSFAGGLNFTYFFGLPSSFNFNLKGKAGVAYLTKPYDKIKHPRNWSYSTHINWFLSAGAGITFPISNKLEFQSEISMNHQSNAAYLEPNGGINYWALSTGINYKINDVIYKPRKVEFDPYLIYPKKTRWDFSFSWGISSNNFNLFGPPPGQVPMYGFTINRSIQTFRIMALLFGAELERNSRAVEIYRRFYPGQKVNPWRCSLLGGVEFLMGRTLLSVQFGGYLYMPFRDIEDRTYQRWGLVYNIWKDFFAGINFKSYRNSADHLSLRITYSIR